MDSEVENIKTTTESTGHMNDNPKVFDKKKLVLTGVFMVGVLLVGIVVLYFVTNSIVVDDCVGNSGGCTPLEYKCAGSSGKCIPHQMCTTEECIKRTLWDEITGK